MISATEDCCAELFHSQSVLFHRCNTHSRAAHLVTANNAEKAMARLKFMFHVKQTVNLEILSPYKFRYDYAE